MPRLTDDNDQIGEENYSIRVLPANSHFKRSLKIITILISDLSISVFALLIFTYVKLSNGPFYSTWGSRDYVKELSIVVCLQPSLKEISVPRLIEMIAFLQLYFRSTYGLFPNPNSAKFGNSYRHVGRGSGI